MNFKYIKSRFSKQNLLNNIGLKIGSLVIAILLWLVVVNVTDPIGTQPFRNVKVNIINTSVITDNGKTFEILDGSDVLSSVTIRAARTILQELGTSNDVIIATADLSKLSPDGQTVPIEFSTSRYNEKVETIRSSSNVLRVNIENRKSIQLPIIATTSGEVESGYILGSVTPQQNQVRISGPESKVALIKSAEVDVQVTGFTEAISTMADIVLYDEEHEVLPKTSISMNVESVRLDAEILATKRVPVYYATIGTPAAGYDLTGEIVCSPETVVIAGTKEDIENVTEINVPASELNVTGQTGNLSAIIDLNKFRPSGIRFADPNFNGKVTFTVYIEGFVENSYSVNLKDVSIDNVPIGFKAEFVESDNIVEYTVTGLAQNIEKLNPDTLGYRVDLSDYQMINDIAEFSEGEYECNLVLDLPEGVELSEPVLITVKLKEDKK